MLAGQGWLILQFQHNGGADALVLIGGNSYTIGAAANQYTKISFAVFNSWLQGGQNQDNQQNLAE